MFYYSCKFHFRCNQQHGSCINTPSQHSCSEKGVDNVYLERGVGDTYSEINVGDSCSERGLSEMGVGNSYSETGLLELRDDNSYSERRLLETEDGNTSSEGGLSEVQVGDLYSNNWLSDTYSDTGVEDSQRESQFNCHSPVRSHSPILTHSSSRCVHKSNIYLTKFLTKKMQERRSPSSRCKHCRETKVTLRKKDRKAVEGRKTKEGVGGTIRAEAP